VIVLDASVLIALAQTEDRHHQRARALLRAGVDEELAASPITLAELLVEPTRVGRPGDALAMVRDLQVRTVPLGDAAPQQLAILRVETGLRMPDCCVLLAAVDTGSSLATFDQRLLAAATKLGLEVVA
jgi:predicted nucleic acid-binding protein